MEVPAAPSVDLRALVMRAVVPRLADRLRTRPSVASPHPVAPLPATASPHDDRQDSVVGEVVDCLLRGDLGDLCRAIDASRAVGRSLERIYLDVLAPAAAAVARLVDADGCPAAAGTLAFCNLQRALRHYAADFYREGGTAPRDATDGSRALLVPVRAAGDLSAFALILAADFLRRAGWEAWVESSLSAAAAERAVAGQWFDLVEVLGGDDDATDAARDAEMEAAAECVRLIRRHGSNPRVVVVACGSAFARDPGLADRIGADHVGSDPLSILRQIDRLPPATPHTRTRRSLS